MGDKKCIRSFGRKPVGKREHSGDLGVDGKILLDSILRKEDRKV